jgi:hypothetical protein
MIRMARFKTGERPLKEDVSAWSRVDGSARYAHLAKNTKPAYHWTATWMPGSDRTIGLLGVTRDRAADERLMNDVEDMMAALTPQVSVALRVCITCEATGRSFCAATGDPNVHMLEADPEKSG